MASTQSVMGTIESFLNTVGRIKAAEAHTEPGSIGGETEHPVKNVDDRTEVAQEGDRSKENESDVKEDQGSVGVNSTPDAKAAADRKKHLWTPRDLASRFAKTAEGGAVQTAGSAHDDHLNIGTNTQPTGEDKSNETSSAKAGKEDPGSDHPARTDNDALDGHKYSNDAAGLDKMAQDLGELGEQLCSQLNWLLHDQPGKFAGDYQHQQNGKFAGDAQTAYQAGYELAGLLTGDFSKEAADQMVNETIQQIIKTASDDADRLAYFYHQRNQAMAEMQKQAAMPGMDPAAMAAMGGGGAPPPPMDPAAMGGGGGGPPPEEAMGGGGMGGEGGGEGGGGDEEALMAALGGGESAEGGEGPPEEGGGGGEGGDDAEIAALLEALQAKEGGGEGGGGGEEIPPEAAAKMGSDRGGKKRPPSPEVKKAARDYLKELVGRSRR